MSEENGMATRDSFRQAAVRRYVTTDSIAPFGKVSLRSLSERERRIIQSKSYDKDGKFAEELHANVFAWTCIFMVLDKPGDEGGEPMFSEALDLEWLSEVDYGSSKPLLDEMNRHAEMGPHEPTDEELKKSSSDATGSDSGLTVQNEQTASTSFV